MVLLEGLRGETAPAERFDFKAYRAAQAAAACGGDVRVAGPRPQDDEGRSQD